MRPEPPKPIPVAKWLESFEVGDECPLCEGKGEIDSECHCCGADLLDDCEACSGEGTIQDKERFLGHATAGNRAHTEAAFNAWRAMVRLTERKWREAYALSDHTPENPAP